MILTFRTANQSDVELINQLAQKIWKKHYPDIISIEQIEYMLKKMYSKESLVQQMNEGHEFILVYYKDEVLGYVSITKNDSNHYFIHKFYVDVSLHRKGIGTQLLKHVIDKLPTSSSIELTVNRQNIKAINFYFKQGFVIDHVADFDIGNGYVMNDFVMKKLLN